MKTVYRCYPFSQYFYAIIGSKGAPFGEAVLFGEAVPFGEAETLLSHAPTHLHGSFRDCRQRGHIFKPLTR